MVVILKVYLISEHVTDQVHEHFLLNTSWGGNAREHNERSTLVRAAAWCREARGQNLSQG